MAIVYTWEITSLRTKTEGSHAEAIVQTYWTKTGTDDDGNTGTFVGATPFTSAEADPFVPFSELTELVVLGWIEAVVVDGYAEHVEEEILKQINDKINPEVEPVLPWAISE